MKSAEIGVIGGSGFYSLLEKPETIDAKNRYGKTSSAISVGRLGTKGVAFLNRHGASHTIPPHKVPYRANIEGLAGAGVKRIIATGACGSLAKDYAPGDFVLFDQFVNMTQGRQDTFFDEDKVVHTGMAHPYCPELRKLAIKEARSMGIRHHETGTIVVVNGPRFSTKAESRFFANQGFHVINMTQYPEAALAREHELCYLGIGIVTDYDVGLEGEPGIKPVDAQQVLKVFGTSMGKVKELITRLIPQIPEKRGCDCGEALKNAVVTSK